MGLSFRDRRAGGTLEFLRGVSRWVIGPGVLVFAAGLALAQGDGTATVSVSGRVVNALTGAAVPRALVSLNSRTVLTDSEGRFSLPAFQANGTGSFVQAYVQVTKPGYAQALDPSEASGQQVSNLSEPLELSLYPDGLITGIITGSDGEPLARAQVTVLPGGWRRVPTIA